MNASWTRRRGFTLIELLVVIAIISILAAILFPVFARARENARRSSCGSNLRQMGLGIAQYTQDYDERLPGAWSGTNGTGKIGGWTFYSIWGVEGTHAAFDPAKGAIYPYLKSAQIFVCPSDSEGQRIGESYSFNACALSNTVGGFGSGKSLAAFDETTRWMLLAEEAGANTGTDDGFQAMSPGNVVTNRHLGGSNIVFIDGHVKWYLADKIIADQLQTGGTGAGPACP